MIVLDSSLPIAAMNEREAHHALAMELLARIQAGGWGEARLPEYVFLEVVAVLAARVDRATASLVGNALLEARNVTLVPCVEHFPGGIPLLLGPRDERPELCRCCDRRHRAFARRRARGDLDRALAKVRGIRAAA